MRMLLGAGDAIPLNGVGTVADEDTVVPILCIFGHYK